MYKIYHSRSKGTFVRHKMQHVTSMCAVACKMSARVELRIEHLKLFYICFQLCLPSNVCFHLGKQNKLYLEIIYIGRQILNTIMLIFFLISMNIVSIQIPLMDNYSLYQS